MIRRNVARFTAAALAAAAVPLIAASVQATQGPNTFGSGDLPTYQTNGVAWTVAEANGLVFVGGTFSSIRPPGAAAGTGEVSRSNFAVFEAATGNPTSCAPRFELASNPASAGVRALNVSPDKKTLYVGGFFGNVSGVNRNHLAAIDIASCSLVANFNPLPNGMVRAIQSTSSAVYYGGAFVSANGQTRGRAAATSAVGTATPGSLLPWAPAFDNDVRALALRPDGTAIVAGGWFNTVNGAASHALAVVDTSAGANLRTYPGLIEQNSRVHDLAADSTGFYTAHDGIGAFDGRIAFNWSDYGHRWTDSCLGATQAVTVYGGILYSGSHAHNCGMMGGFPDGPRWHFLAQSVNDPKLLPWFPNTDEGIGEQIGPRDMIAATGTGSGDYMWAVGEFTRVNGKPQQGITRFGQGAQSNATPSKPAVTITSPASGQARVAWRQSLDTDDANLTYRVYRDDAATPVYTTSGTSWFWERRQLSFTDTGLAPGSVHKYRVEVTDGSATDTTSYRNVTIGSSSSAYANRVLADGASFLWRYDDSNDVLFADASANNNNGTLKGVVERVKPGAISGDPSGAITLSGVSSHLYTEKRFDPVSAFTQESWLRTTTTAGGKIIGFGSNQLISSAPYDKHIYMTNSGQLVFGVYTPATGTVVLTSPRAYNDGGWHHVAATQGSNGMALYVDGVLVASNSETRNEQFPGYVRVGGDNLNHWPNMPTSHYWAGTLDETALYPTALSAQAVADHYRIGTSGGPVVDVDTAAPTTPTGVAASVSGTTATLTWTASTDNVGVAGYDVYRSSVSGFTPDGTNFVGQGNTGFTEGSLQAGTWYYRVVAKDAAGNRSAASAQATAVINAPPVAAGAPTGLRVLSRTTDQVQISFNPVAGATLYKAYVSQTPGTGRFLWNSGFNVIPVTLSSLRGPWYIVVTAVVNGVESPFSNEVYSETAAPPPPPAGDTAAPSVPANPTASASGNSVTVRWTASTDNVGVTGYDVYRSPDPGFTPGAATLVGSVTSVGFSDSGLAPGTYHYRVIAKDAAGNRSAASASASAVVAAAPPPPPPAQGPGVVNLAANADAYATETAPGVSYGTTPYLVQRSTPGMISYLKFAIPAASSGRTLTSAVLRLRTISGAEAGSTSYQLIQTAGNGWTEQGLTWGSRPAMTSGAFAYLIAPAADTTYDTTVHPYFINSAAGSDVTLAITSLGTDPLWFWSKDSPTAGQRPQLILTYS